MTIILGLKAKKRSTSFWLSAEGKRLLKALAERDGISQSAVIEQLLREKARREGLAHER